MAVSMPELSPKRGLPTLVFFVRDSGSVFHQFADDPSVDIDPGRRGLGEFRSEYMK
jgi:hypothetical protein